MITNEEIKLSMNWPFFRDTFEIGRRNAYPVG